jgi:hypothetical protein
MEHCVYCHRDVESQANHLQDCHGLFQPWAMTVETQKLCKRRKGGCR